jgi:hypothetical protein
MTEYPPPNPGPGYPDPYGDPYGDPGLNAAYDVAGHPQPYPPPYAPAGDAGTDLTQPLPPVEPSADDVSGAPTAKERVAGSAQAGKQAAGEVAQSAADRAKDVAAETKHQARTVLSTAQEQLREQTRQQHRNLVDKLRSLGEELSAMARGSEQSGTATDLVSQAGERAHSAASWLDAREPGELVDELRSFARRRPGAFLVGALAAGVVAGRLTRGAVAAHSDDADPAAQAAISGTGMPS